MTESTDRAPPRPGSPRARAIGLWIVAALILIPGGYGFIEKFVQFIRTLALETDEGGGFAIIPIVNYLLVTAGMTCLLAWAVVHGMFRDIERPKYTMLEQEALLDRRDEQVENDDDE